MTYNEHEELSTKLFEAVSTGDPSKVEAFFQGAGEEYEFPCVCGENSWDFETSEYFEDAVTHFLALPADKRNPQVLVSLANHGAELNYREDGHSILQYAYTMQYPEIVPDLFKAGATLFNDTVEEEPVLTTAVLDGTYEYLDALLTHGDLQNNKFDKDALLEVNDENPIGAAIMNGEKDKFIRLAKALFPDENMLKYAVRNTPAETVKNLLEEVPLRDWAPITNSQTESLLYDIIMRKDFDAPLIANELLERGAIQDNKDERWLVPIFAAVEEKANPDVGKIMINYWLKMGHSLLDENKASESIFEHAVHAGTPEIVKYMLDKQPDLIDEQAKVRTKETPIS